MHKIFANCKIVKFATIIACFCGGGGECYLKNIEAPDLRLESLSGVGDLDALVAPTPG